MQYEPPKYATQFALWHLFAMTSVAALLIGVTASRIRRLSIEQWGYAGIALLSLAVIFLWSNYIFAARYRRGIADIGKPLGELRFHPLIPRSVVAGSLVAIVILSLAILIGMINLASLSISQRLANIAQGSFIAGVCLAVICKRTFVKSLLIYGERGVCDGDHFYSWSAVTIRQGGMHAVVLLRRVTLTESVAIEGDIHDFVAAKTRCCLDVAAVAGKK